MGIVIDVEKHVVLCRTNNCQDWLKMSGNMLVYLIIQNLRFDYIFDTMRNYGFNYQHIRKIHSSIFKILLNGRVSLWATPTILFKTL